MSDYCAYLSNCLAIGTKTSPKSEEGWIRDKIEWNLSNYNVILRQKKHIITEALNGLRNQWTDSSIVIVKNVPKSKVSVAGNIAKDLAAMLSFAGQSQVRFHGYEYPVGSGQQTLHSTSGIAKFFRPTFDVRNGKTVESFIEKCWPAYRKLKRPRKLKIVFEILTTSETPTLPFEIRLVSIFLALENLKDTYAKSKGIPYYKGYYRKTSSPPKSSLSKAKKYSFEELLSLMLKEQGINKGLKRIIRLRNDIIHSGISRRPHKSQVKIFENCHEIIRRYILKLLGYMGSYCSYEKPNTLLRV